MGNGAFGSVYKARNTKIERKVAIKIIPVISSDSKKLEKAIKEASTLFDLKHQHIVRYYESYEPTPRFGKGLAIVMEYCSNGDLQSYLSRAGNHPDIIQRLKWYHQLADACSYLHKKQIAHRDIKPANILVDGHNHLHLCDVGLAKAAWGITASGNRDFKHYMTSAAGTRYYMAPEVWSGHYTNKCDVFSLGVVFIKIAESRAIIDNPTTDQGQPLGKVLSASVQKPCDVVNCPFNNAERAEIVLCNKMLQYDSEIRPDMGEVKKNVGYMKTEFSKLQSLVKQYNGSIDNLIQTAEEERIYVKNLNEFYHQMANATKKIKEIWNTNESKLIFILVPKTACEIKEALYSAFTDANDLKVKTKPIQSELLNTALIKYEMQTPDCKTMKKVFDEIHLEKNVLQVKKDFNNVSKWCASADRLYKAMIAITVFLLFLSAKIFLKVENGLPVINDDAFTTIVYVAYCISPYYLIIFRLDRNMLDTMTFSTLIIVAITIETNMMAPTSSIFMSLMCELFVICEIINWGTPIFAEKLGVLQKILLIGHIIYDILSENYMLLVGLVGVYVYINKKMPFEKLGNTIDSVLKSIDVLHDTILANSTKLVKTKQCIENIASCYEDMYPHHTSEALDKCLDNLYKHYKTQSPPVRVSSNYILPTGVIEEPKPIYFFICIHAIIVLSTVTAANVKFCFSLYNYFFS